LAEEEIAFERMIKNTGVAPSQDTQIGRMMGDEMGRRMRPYIRLSDDPPEPTPGE